MNNQEVNKSGLWSPLEDHRLKELVAAGMSAYEISDSIGRSVPAIFSRADRLNLPRPHRKTQRLNASYSASSLPDLNNSRERHKAHIANIMHLVDLKRAGHSPTQTELRISPDCSVSSVAQPKPEPSLSSCSNALAW